MKANVPLTEARLVIVLKRVGMVTRRDLETMGVVTKKDLVGMATKRDLEGVVTKQDLKRMATKKDVRATETRLRGEIIESEGRVRGEIKQVAKNLEELELAIARGSENHEERIHRLEGLVAQ